MTIYKYKLGIAERQTIEMPLGAKILAVQTQSNHPCIWALVDPSKGNEQVNIATYGTGHPFKGGKYLGTYQVNELVFHVFKL